MAIAIKCDACGKLYEQYKGVNTIYLGTTKWSIYNGRTFDKKKLYDLCPDCLQKLKDMLNIK